MKNTVLFTFLFGTLFTILIVAITSLIVTLWKHKRKWFYYIVIAVVPTAFFMAWYVRPQ